MLLALAVALPFVLLTAGIMWQLANNERETRREAILFSTRTLMNAVDTVLSKQIAVAQMLATSPALQGDDLATFREEARRSMSGLSGGWIVLADETGQQLINLAPGATEPLPRRPEAGMKIQRRAFETGQVQISGVFNGAVLQSPTVAVELPVFRKEKPPVEIIIGMQPNVFLSLFEQWNLPEGWLAGLVDRDGNLIARSRNHEQTVGKPASEGFRAATRTAVQGWNEMKSLEGATIANAHVTSPLSGWAMGIGRGKVAVRGADPGYDPDRGAGRRRHDAAQPAAGDMVGAADRPTDRADRTGHPRADAAASDLVLEYRPARGRPHAGCAGVHRARVFEQHDKERDEREAHVRLIMRELSHRSKNLLAIVLAIARQTSRHTTSFSDFESRFNSRIQALADAHDLLVEQQWSGAQIDDLVKAQLAAFGVEKVTCRGERILLKAEAVQNVRAGAARARDQCVEIRCAVGAGRQGQHRLGARAGGVRRAQSSPDVAGERRAAGDRAEPEGFRLLRAGARDGQCARRRQARVQSGRAGLDLHHPAGASGQ
jgi:hypothetical protein